MFLRTTSTEQTIGHLDVKQNYKNILNRINTLGNEEIDFIKNNLEIIQTNLKTVKLLLQEIDDIPIPIFVGVDNKDGRTQLIELSWHVKNLSHAKQIINLVIKNLNISKEMERSIKIDNCSDETYIQVKLDDIIKLQFIYQSNDMIENLIKTELEIK